MMNFPTLWLACTAAILSFSLLAAAVVDAIGGY